MSNWFNVAPNEHLAGKVAVVLGGASGIGQAAACTLAAAGAKVVVSGIPEENCIATAEMITADGGVALAKSCDATCQEQIESLIQFAVDEFGGIDIAVSSCGIAIPRQDILTISREQWAHVFDVNLDANFFYAQAAAKVMKDNEAGGRMVFVSSARGDFPMINAGPYAVTKAALSGMVRALCVDLAKYNITVNGIAPGIVRTPMNKQILDELPGYMDMVMDRTPLKNVGSVDDMAAVILLLCLPQSRYTSGQVFTLDGGWSVNS